MAKSFFSEFKRRNVFKVGVAYLVLAWIVIQVTSEAVPALHLPEWVNSFVFFIGAIGFPFALFFAWVFEVTPDGIKRESEISPEDSITTHTSRKLDFIIIGLLIITAGYFIYESRFKSISTPSLKQDPEGTSIAVLPFINMSSDKEQEYFSDGISEEILNVLAKIPNLQVTSRSSAFAYKGKEINISEVAKILGVKNILEGSVRKSGTRVRITAQLINAGTDKHLWSETYDRELDDIFKVQDEISVAIVDALKEALGIELVKTASTAQSIDPEAYDLYLKGLRSLNRYTYDELQKAVVAFKAAINIAPDFTLAKMKLALTYAYQIGTGSRYDIEILDTADSMMADVLTSNPHSAEAFFTRAFIANRQGNQVKEKQYASEAYRLNPNNADVISAYVRVNYVELGEVESKKLYQRAIQIDPLNDKIYFRYAQYLRSRIQAYSEAENVYRDAIRLNPDDPNNIGYLGIMYFIDMKKYVESLKLIEKAQLLDPNDPDWMNLLSRAWFNLGNSKKALEFTAKAISINPHYARTILGKAHILIYNERQASALKLLTDTLDNEKTEYRLSSKSILLAKAVYILLMQNEISEAEMMIEHYFPNSAKLVDEPLPKTFDEVKNPRVIALLSTVYRAQNRFALADQFSSRLKLLNEESLLKGKKKLDLLDYLFLSETQAAQNNVDQAIIYLEAATEHGAVSVFRQLFYYSPFFISLNQNPRYIALIKRIEQEAAKQRSVLERPVIEQL